MLEIPEAIVIAAELNQTIKDKHIEKVAFDGIYYHNFPYRILVVCIGV